MEQEHLEKLQEGVSSWNLWREQNPIIRPSLRNVNFEKCLPSKRHIYNLPYFDDANFSNCDLHRVSLRNGSYFHCVFDGSSINWADFVDGYFYNCSFRNVEMRVSKIGSAKFINCLFEDSDLSYCSAEETDFKGSRFFRTKLEHMSLVKCNFAGTIIDSCSVYGTAAWDLNLDNSRQENIIITSDDSEVITIDNLELAQFLYLLINNKKLRNVIDTITSKVVLLLGNFSTERKAVLDNMRKILRHNDYIPVMFDFEKPTSRNLTETIVTLASMSRFIVADLSSPRSLPHELCALVPRLQSVSLYPVICNGEEPYGMFSDFSVYTSVKTIREYSDNTIEDIVRAIIAEDKR
jgi:uncharacterized protein YjbI with pentapeptide repeats